MKIRLESIDSKDARPTGELQPGETVTHDVVVSINGRPRTFNVYLKANVLSSFDASVVYGDERLEALFRFDPVALNVLYRAVGKYRRHASQVLPIVLVDSDDAKDTRAAIGPG